MGQMVPRTTYNKPISRDAIILNTDAASFSVAQSATLRYRIAENPWGKGSLVRGTDYTDTVSIGSGHFPSWCRFDWSWPTPGTGAVMSYPFDSLESITTPYPQISSLTTIKSTHTFAYQLNGWATVMYDTWLFTDSGGVTIAFELQYFIATRGYTSALNQTFRNYSQPYISLDSLSVDVYQITGGAWPRMFLFPTTQQANIFTNPSMSGSSAGIPGTPPTDISVQLNASGLSSQIVQSGTSTASDGTSVDWVEVRFFGTVGGSNTNVNFQLNGTAFGFLIPWVANQKAWFSAYVERTGGTSTGITNIQFAINGYDASGNYNNDTTGGLSIRDTLSGSALQHFGLQYIPATNTVNLNPSILLSVTASAHVDITLRIGNVVLSNDVTINATSQVFDWKAFFNAMVTAGFMTGSEYLQTIQLGPEVVNGDGYVAMSKFEVVQS